MEISDSPGSSGRKKRRIYAIIIIFTSHKLAISAAVTEELPPLASNETNSPSEDR